jgi:hypothetical protein
MISLRSLSHVGAAVITGLVAASLLLAGTVSDDGRVAGDPDSRRREPQRPADAVDDRRTGRVA